jgi:hypothetical protein
MGGKPNPKPNLIPNPKPNPKTVGEKSSPNPNPQHPKPVDIHPEPDPLPSLHTSSIELAWRRAPLRYDALHIYVFYIFIFF